MRELRCRSRNPLGRISDQGNQTCAKDHKELGVCQIGSIGGERLHEEQD